MKLSIFILCSFLAVALSATLAPSYQVTYYRWTAGDCQGTPIETVQIVQGTCNPEYDGASRGIITVNTATTLTSCDYNDTQCNTVKDCLPYNSDQCYTYADGSSKYTITQITVPTTYDVTFYEYSDNNCQTPKVISKIIQNKCNSESDGKSAGFITALSATAVRSCDYSDTMCSNDEKCVTYNAGQCYQFADGTSQTYTVRPSNSNYVTYRNYSDEFCSTPSSSYENYWLLDSCNPEYGNSGRAGVLTYINSTAIKSCDFSDLRCTQLLNCIYYVEGACESLGNSGNFELAQVIVSAQKTSSVGVITASFTLISALLAFLFL